MTELMLLEWAATSMLVMTVGSLEAARLWVETLFLPRWQETSPVPFRVI